MTHALRGGKATQQQTKAHNDSLVLSTIYEAGEISRAAVARRTGLSRTSAGEADAPLLGLGIGTPGLIDLERGSPVHWAVNLDWLDVPLRDLLAARYGLPVYVLNDSQAAAMGEYFFGAHDGTGNLVVIKSEEGLGAGVVLEGSLLHGDHFGAGEIGHLVFDDGGRTCQCGNR